MAEGRWISYLRVSTGRQGRSGLGLEAQRKAVEDFFGSWQLAREFVEVESGKKTSLRRPRLLTRRQTADLIGTSERTLKRAGARPARAPRHCASAAGSEWCATRSLAFAAGCTRRWKPRPAHHEQIRRSGVLCLRKHIHPSLGWRLELDPDPGNSFQPAEVFVTTADLNRAGITPRHGMRISFAPRSLRELPEPEKPKRPIRLHAGAGGVVGHASGKNKKAQLA